jgi:hypothetical protein
MTKSADLDRLFIWAMKRMTGPNARLYDMPHAASITVQAYLCGRQAGQDSDQDRSSNLRLLSRSVQRTWCNNQIYIEEDQKADFCPCWVIAYSQLRHRVPYTMLYSLDSASVPPMFM